MKDAQTAIGERLRMLIDDTGKTQQTIAADLHISSSALSGYVNNTRQPDFGMLRQLAEYFDTTTDFLLGASGIRDTEKNLLSDDEVLLVSAYRKASERAKNVLLKETQMMAHEFPVH